MMPVDFSFNEYSERSFKYYDQKLIDKINSGCGKCAEFFRLLTLCHSGMTEEKDGGKVVLKLIKLEIE